MIRYLEIRLPAGDHVLVPQPFALNKASGVKVQAILADQFTLVPKTKSNEQITLLEEEKIMAYFGAGLLYATPERQEPRA
jgi:photosynthetic reaction center H subunit